MTANAILDSETGQETFSFSPGSMSYIQENFLVTFTPADLFIAEFTPTNVGPTAHSGGGGGGGFWQKNWDCVKNVGLPVVADDLNPFSPGVGTAADATSQMSQASLGAAASWSVERGLTVPMRSPVVRVGVASADALADLSAVAGAISVVWALKNGIVAERQGCTF